MHSRPATAGNTTSGGGEGAADDDASHGADEPGGDHPGGDDPGGDDPGGEIAIADLERIVIGAVGITTRALELAAPGVDLTFSQWRALLILGEPEGMRVGEVAARVGVTLPATSRFLRRLERRELVALARDETDRRATRARLTDRGREVRDAILSFRRSALRDVVRMAEADRLPGSGEAIKALAASFDRYA